MSNQTLDVLRRGWTDACSAIAPDAPEIAQALLTDLNGGTSRGAYDEPALLQIIDEVLETMHPVIGTEQVLALQRRLKRTVYEYLLARDALSPEETQLYDEDIVEEPRSSVLIGAEEIAALGGEAASPATATAGFEETEANPDSEIANHAPPEPPAAAGALAEPAYVVSPDGFHLADPGDLLAARGDIDDFVKTPLDSIGVSPPPDPRAWQDNTADFLAELYTELQAKRFAEVADKLEEMAKRVKSRRIAEAALAAGDYCRDAGKTKEAIRAYLASTSADPIFEAPLARLAEVHASDREPETAVNYLERLASLKRVRGDHRGAIRVYRELVTLAPYREDIVELLVQATATGILAE